jgi:oxygen-dependent protoporphyrinogen oxidase
MSSPAHRAASPPYVVVGAGFTGLLAARRLAQAGHAVVALDAADRVGGQVHTGIVGGRPIDLGSEATHLMYPQVGALIDELGLRESMVLARPGTSWLWTPRGLRPLPEGVGPAGPTRLRPVLRSRVMSLPGLVRAGLEPVVAGRGRLPAAGEDDMAVGDFVASRFGRQVADRLVDPLLGSLHSGDVRRLSLRACAPSLVPAATSGASLLRASRARSRAGARPGPAVSFVAWPQGLVALTDALLAGLGGLAPGAVEVRLQHRVTALTPSPDGYRLTATGPEGPVHLSAAGVLLAVPAARAAELLRPVVPAAAAGFAQTPAASVATVVLGLPPAPVRRVPAMRANGLLVPSTEGSLLKASTFLSNKWAHLEDTGVFWLRMSAGRYFDERLAALDDDALVDHLRRDLRRFTGLDVHPDVVAVRRWPSAMPQLLVGHSARVAAARAALAAALPGVGVAGASYDGVGLASCITSATLIAAEVAAGGGRLGAPDPERTR